MPPMSPGQWGKVGEAEFFIAEEHFHYNAKVIAESYRQQTSIVRDALSQRLAITPCRRKGKGIPRNGIMAGPLNASLRSALKGPGDSGMRLECVERGGYFVSGAATQGFDFAYIDEAYNTVAYRNVCRGSRHLHDGEAQWKSAKRKRLRIVELDEGHAVYSIEQGVDINQPRQAPVILGEIQFGNWALLYYDFFKALSALDARVLDLHIYICATGALQGLLSEGIVNFVDARDAMEQRANVLRFPIWLIGLDLRNPS